MKFVTKAMIAAPAFALLATFSTAGWASANGLVLSQVYGGGGNSGAALKNDFIEVFNAGSSPVSLGGYSVQYASSGGSTWAVTNLTGVTLAPGQHYLVQESAGTGGTTNLPTPDATGNIAMSATAGKVALVSSTTALTGSNPSGAQVIDLVGFGGANFFEGSGPTPGLSNTTAALRNSNGCIDTDNNAADFSVGAPNPRNTPSAPTGCGGGTAPSVSLSVTPASFAENGGSATVTATLSASSAAPVTVNLNFSGSATNGTDYSASASSITIPASATSGSVTLNAIDDTTYEGDETITATLGALSNATAGTPSSVTATILDNEPVPPPVIGAHIYEIQGAQHRSPMVGMSVTNVPGIVTAVASTGFYMQDADGDGDVKTSDGIFVFTSTPTVSVGQQVLVSASVSEFRPNGASDLGITELDNPSVTVRSANDLFTNTSITPTVIGAGGRVPPTQFIDSDTNGNIETSLTTVFNPDVDGIDFYESLEGMLVTINNPVMTSRNLASTASAGKTYWVLADNGAGVTGRTARGGIALVKRAAGIDFNPERIELFTGLPNTNAPTNAAFNVGDRLNGPIRGVMSYFDNFEVLPTAAPSVSVAANNPKTVHSLAVGTDRLTLGGYNVENLAPSDPQSKFDKLAIDIVTAIGAPDILSLAEIQDNSGATDNGIVAADVTINKLITAIHNASGPTYSFATIDPVNDQDGGQPGGNIRVAQFYNPARVTFVPGTSGAGDSTTATALSLSGGKLVLTLSPGRVAPTDSAWSSSRKPLAVTYDFNGQRVVVINNHFNSKIGDDPTYGVNQPPLLNTEAQRRQQATLVHDFVYNALQLDPNAKIAVLGDLNDFDFSAPLRILRDGPLTAAGGEGSQLALLNLSSELVAAPEERYSYVFDGNSQELDHILATPSLFADAQYQAIHVNAEYANQNSDHDPLLASFKIDDTTPDSFTFIDVPNAFASATYVSNSITVSGITGAASLVLTSAAPTAQYSINGAGFKYYNTNNGQPMVSSGDTVSLRIVSSATGGGAVSATLSLGGVTSTWTVTTQAGNTMLSKPLVFAPKTAGSSVVTISGAQKVLGITTPVAISIGGDPSALYRINGGDFTSASGTVKAGDIVQLRVLSGPLKDDVRTATLTVSGQSSDFVVTTGSDTTVTPFRFAALANQPRSTLVTSAQVTVSGVSVAVPISISGDATAMYSINGGAPTNAAGMVGPGQTVTLQLITSALVSTTSSAVVTIGDRSATWNVKTVPK